MPTTRRCIFYETERSLWLVWLIHLTTILISTSGTQYVEERQDGQYVLILNNAFSTSHEASHFKKMKKVDDVAQARVYPIIGSCVVVRDEEGSKSWTGDSTPPQVI